MNKLFIYIIAYMIVGCNNKDLRSVDLVSNKTDTLKYSQQGFNDGILLSLINNNTFEYEKYSYSCTGVSNIEKAFGYYEKDSSHLKLIPEIVKVEIEDIDFEIDLKEMESKYNSDSSDIKTDYFIVDWGENKYLLSEDFSIIEKEQINDFHRFSEYFNAGYEPRKNGRYLVNKSNHSDLDDNELNLKSIPIKWRHLFLKQPIRCFVKKIRVLDSKRNEELEIFEIEIDKGFKGKVRRGMKFTNELGSISIKIDSVRKYSSFGKAYIYDMEENLEIKLGIELRTKWK